MSRLNSCCAFFFSFSLTLSALSARAQDYDEEWKKIDAFIKKGRPASAFEKAKEIFQRAKANKQEAQVIKSLIYINNLQGKFKENSELLSIANLEKEIDIATDPVRALLQNMTAEVYRNYYTRIRWKLYGRTKTDNYKSYDIDTWSITDFHRKITELFTASLKNDKLLQAISLQEFDPILQKGNARMLRPTLYDLLANRALDYFRNDERDINNCFEISCTCFLFVIS